ncbi:putative non-specific serine/threonine protein kinase [Helianthus annuus]|nr:putative non-specific serine/threonine protein kinase [Helianthus annuus]
MRRSRRRIKVELIIIYFSMVAFFYSACSLNSDGQTLLSLASHWVSAPPTWNASHDDPCGWLGVLCDPVTNLVVSLNLSASHIVGELGPEISQLTHLKTLNLSLNTISGTIPPEIANCTRLQQLDLFRNNFTGSPRLEALKQPCQPLSHFRLGLSTQCACQVFQDRRRRVCEVTWNQFAVVSRLWLDRSHPLFFWRTHQAHSPLPLHQPAVREHTT